jgi:hypothetical protein
MASKARVTAPPQNSQKARKLNPDDRFSSLARLQAVGYFGPPKICALYEATYLDGLRKAGMPEE